MKKKALALLLVSAMTASLFAGCGSKNTTDTQANTPAADSQTTEEEPLVSDDPNTINIWVADLAVDFTKEKAEAFLAGSEYNNYKVFVRAVGEGDAAGKMIADTQGGADIYGFAQDQLARLVAAKAIMPVAPENAQKAKDTSDASAIKAATVGDTLYALPITADNGYFLFYDKSVVTNPADFDAIIADCEAAGKTFNFEINSGWYQPSFFFGEGCDLNYETDEKGNFTKCNVSYANEKGVAALKEIIKLANSSAFVNGSSVDKATNAAAIVTGTWDAKAAQEKFKENYACAKLPAFTDAAGNSVQLGGFSGYKFLGVKPQTDAAKLKAILALTNYLASEEVQTARYTALGWGPANLKSQADPAVQADVALSALRDQLQFMEPQGQYPGDYWDSAAKGLGDDIIAKKLNDKTDDELLSVLKDFETKCQSYVK